MSHTGNSAEAVDDEAPKEEFVEKLVIILAASITGATEPRP
jgi:hypothetical protein